MLNIWNFRKSLITFFLLFRLNKYFLKGYLKNNWIIFPIHNPIYKKIDFFYWVAQYVIFENVPKKWMESVNKFARYSQKTAKSDSKPIVA